MEFRNNGNVYDLLSAFWRNAAGKLFFSVIWSGEVAFDVIFLNRSPSCQKLCGMTNTGWGVSSIMLEAVWADKHWMGCVKYDARSCVGWQTLDGVCQVSCQRLFGLTNTGWGVSSIMPEARCARKHWMGCVKYHARCSVCWQTLDGLCQVSCQMLYVLANTRWGVSSIMPEAVCADKH